MGSIKKLNKTEVVMSVLIIFSILIIIMVGSIAIKNPKALEPDYVLVYQTSSITKEGVEGESVTLQDRNTGEMKTISWEVLDD